MIIGDALKALGQIGDPRFRNVLLLGTGLSIGLLAGFTWLFVAVLQWMIGPSVTLPWIGEITWLDDAAGWLSLPLMLGLSVVLMVPVASAFTGLFLDRIMDAVEAVHYPGLPPAQSVSIMAALRDSLGFLGILLLANLLALIGYLLFAPFAPLIFWAVNGFLLGREYAQMVALRRLGPEGARAFRRANRAQIWAAGVMMAIPLSVPILNLLVPVIGAASFTHLFHRVSRHRQSG